MRSLELFCGSKSFSKIFEKNKYETITIDIDNKHNPTICKDILEWDYKIYPPKYFDVIWASPDCRSWSIATHKHRTVKERTNLVMHTESISIHSCKATRRPLESSNENKYAYGLPSLDNALLY